VRRAVKEKNSELTMVKLGNQILLKRICLWYLDEKLEHGPFVLSAVDEDDPVPIYGRHQKRARMQPYSQPRKLSHEGAT
jgi:hypothetical protein